MAAQFPYRRVMQVIATYALCVATMTATYAIAEEPSDQGLTLAITQGSSSTEVLSQMSLEDLMNVEVTSVSRYKQKASDAPAAITVISQDDIARSGLHSIPELLRLSPGMSVARIDAHSWAVTARGFNDKYANKLLVLMDGRTLYLPIFSGVVWEQQDYLLEDLERIEVIRGPGATIWGANAVNGVVNITTKSARDTQGGLVSGMVSNVDNGGGIRYGGKLDEETYYRIFGIFRKTEDFVDPSGSRQFDGWQSARGGFRIDRYGSPNDTLTLQSEVYQNLYAERNTLPQMSAPFTFLSEETNYGGGNYVLGRWTHRVASDSEYSLQLYYDRYFRQSDVLDYAQHTFDADFEHRFPLGDRQSFVWGAGVRYLTDSLDNTPISSFNPAERNDYRLSTFIQDDITIVPNRFHLIFGSKFEYTSYSDFEYQPSIRALWTPNESNTVWGAVSRAIHNPTQVEQDGQFLVQTFAGDGGVPVGVYASHNDDQKSQELTAYELGYRVRPRENLSIDIAGFFNHYEGITSTEPGSPRLITTPAPQVIISNPFGNGLDANSFGIETGVNLKIGNNWLVSGSYSFIDIQVHRRSSSQDSNAERTLEGSDPRNQVQVHTSYQLTRNLQLNGSAYYVEQLQAVDVPSYVRVDVGLTWQPRKDLSLRIGVQNLLDDRHPEAGPGLFGSQVEMPRTVYGQLSWQF